MLNLNRIYNGDCLELMPSIPDKSIDLILTDLPYQVTDNAWDTIIPFDNLWEQFNRVIKDNGAIVLTSQQPFSTKLINSNPKMFRYEWIWVKNRITNFANAKKMPMRKHESVLVFYKKLPTYNPQGLVRLDKPRKGDKAPSKNYDSKALCQDYFQEFTNYPNTILNFDCEYGLHQTQKPVALFEYLIKTYSNEGETVLDCCSGSGTTAIACTNTNRQFICIEKNVEYYMLSIERLNKHLSII